ncbi:MAG: sn-glycerol-3-phosphate ABC transporter ATP-binding protein UgpC [Armatimonadota bacterium]|nr:sn-glycerol-3-phosphate ABC transporter ATP-binding protein UgpC [Armatimonadota bacterium]
MASVTLSDLCKSFKDVLAVNHVNLEIHDKEFLVLVGPSGCGKTTALRMIAGLEDATSGEIRIGERVVNDVSPKDRDIAMVFQNYALYPHMTVYDNMAFGLRLRRKPGLFGGRVFSEAEIKQRVDHAASILDLGSLLKRKPKELSGGQRQRVALGRAIVREPKVFLMDEPLSNLDAKLRVQTRAELIKLHRRLEITTVYVTHDQVEAMTMGNRIAVMKDGLVQQVDTPLGLYNRPVNKFVAGFIGSPAMNFVPVKLQREGSDLYLATDGLNLRIPDSAGIGPAADAGAEPNAHAARRAKPNLSDSPAGRALDLGIRPEDLSILPPNALLHEGSTFRAVVDVVEPMGATELLYLSAGQTQLIANVDSETGVKEGHTVDVFVDMGRIHLFDEAEAALC